MTMNDSKQLIKLEAVNVIYLLNSVLLFLAGELLPGVVTNPHGQLTRSQQGMRLVQGTAYCIRLSRGCGIDIGKSLEGKIGGENQAVAMFTLLWERCLSGLIMYIEYMNTIQYSICFGSHPDEKGHFRSCWMSKTCWMNKYVHCCISQ